MSSPIALKDARSGETPITHLAGEGSRSSVSSFMFLQAAEIGETFIALLAHIWFLSGVDWAVSLKVSESSGTLAIKIAANWSLTGVWSFVFPQAAAIGETSRALLARLGYWGPLHE